MNFHFIIFFTNENTVSLGYTTITSRIRFDSSNLIHEVHGPHIISLISGLSLGSWKTGVAVKALPYPSNVGELSIS